MAILGQMRTLLWQAMVQTPRNATPITTQFTDIETRIRALGQAQQIAIAAAGDGELIGGDGHLLRVALAELEHAGIVVYGQNRLQLELPWVQITEFGIACLDAGQINPMDPDGYLTRLDAEVPNLHPVARAYVEESLTCLRQRCVKACAVMLGCAAEQILLVMIDALHAAIQDPGRKQSFRARVVKERQAGTKFTRFRAEMQQNVLRLLPNALSEDLDLRLDGIHSLIRRARNDAGHPALSANLTAQDVNGALLLFPGYCRTAYGLLAFFQHNLV